MNHYGTRGRGDKSKGVLPVLSATVEQDDIDRVCGSVMGSTILEFC